MCWFSLLFVVVALCMPCVVCCLLFVKVCLLFLGHCSLFVALVCFLCHLQLFCGPLIFRKRVSLLFVVVCGLLWLFVVVVCF